MKKLFMMVALSLVMVACNKEEESELTGWDKIIAEIEPVEISIIDVLHSLDENEVWKCRSAYSYVLNETTGEVEEHIQVEDYFYHIYGADMATLRYVDNVEFRFYTPSPFAGITEPYAMIYNMSMEDDDTIKLVSQENDISRYNIIAYDENQIIFDVYNANEEGTKWLYKKMWYERKVDDTKWWEDAK